MTAPKLLRKIRRQKRKESVTILVFAVPKHLFSLPYVSNSILQSAIREVHKLWVSSYSELKLLQLLRQTPTSTRLAENMSQMQHKDTCPSQVLPRMRKKTTRRKQSAEAYGVGGKPLLDFARKPSSQICCCCCMLLCLKAFSSRLSHPCCVSPIITLQPCSVFWMSHAW